jgi:hypothetical protein
MENSCRKKYKPSPKKWILASRCAGFRRNSALIPANAGLFHYAGNCPVRYIDPDGRFWDTVWDLYSLGVGIKSFINNVKEGDVLGAVMDGAGIIADAAAVAMPFVPGGASCAVKTARAVATGIAGAGEVAAGAKNVYEGVRDGDTLQVLDGTVQIVSGANTVKGSAGKLAEGLCFIAGTLTLTDDGLVPIESIHKGDEVYSFIEETGSIELRPVLNTFCREVTELVIVTTDRETIKTTPTHPFMTEDFEWCEAGNLVVGTRLKTFGRDVEAVISVERIELDEPVLVYNFEVAEGHTYFVTGTGVLVHNACGKTAPGAEKKLANHQREAKQIESVSKSYKINRWDFGDYVEARKKTEGMTGGDVLQYRTLEQWAKDFIDDGGY